MSGCDARDRVAGAIGNYLDGRIDNYELDDVLSERDVQADPTCRAIAYEMSLLYDDFRRRRNEGKYRISEKGERMIRRWIVVLKSEWVYPEEEASSGRHRPLRALLELVRWNLCVRSKIGKNQYWPLRSRDEWLQLRDRVGALGEGRDEPDE